jgi:hypothetical protein
VEASMDRSHAWGRESPTVYPPYSKTWTPHKCSHDSASGHELWGVGTVADGLASGRVAELGNGLNMRVTTLVVLLEWYRAHCRSLLNLVWCGMWTMGACVAVFKTFKAALLDLKLRDVSLLKANIILRVTTEPLRRRRCNPS